jgi:RimJ/RimL family protein N-acetyltransferase
MNCNVKLYWKETMINNLFKNIILETDRLILRNFVKEDKDDFYIISRDPKIYETLPEDHMYSMDEISEIIDWFIYQYDNNTLKNIPKFPLAIILKNEQKLIGDIGIGHYSNDKSKMELFYFINSNYWNNGYVSEAVKIFLKYVKENELAISLLGTVVSKNIASIKILMKNGFQKMGTDYIEDNHKREIYELKII